jgi:putative transposase
MVAKPPRDSSSFDTSTYFITANAFNGQALFQSERVAKLLVGTLLEYRQQNKFLVHEFVVMPNHLHVLLTTVEGITLERAVQLIKGGCSFRSGKELEMRGEIWQRGYVDHRMRDGRDFANHREYIRQNPVKRHLAEKPAEFVYGSAFPGFELDEAPQGLKPIL